MSVNDAMLSARDCLNNINIYNKLDFYNKYVRFNGQINNSDLCFEWKYHMRRDMQEIVAGVYLGPYGSAIKAKKDALQSCGITHIICVRQKIKSRFIRRNFPDSYVYLTLEIADTPTQSITEYISTVREFIDECLAKGGKVLVHGNAGISRSAALVIAYIMENKSLGFDDAIKLVQGKRYCIFPNEGFRQQLIEYELIIRENERKKEAETSSEVRRILDNCGFDEIRRRKLEHILLDN